MAIKTIRRIASEILNIGENKIKIKSDEVSKAKEALTREDVRGLIKDGTVYKTKKQGVSRANAKERHKQRKKGRQKGAGRKKGRVKKQPKEQWMAKARIQRSILNYLAKNGLIETDKRKDIYYKIKGGFFKSKRALIIYINDNKLTKEKIEHDELIKKIREQKPKKPIQVKTKKKVKKVVGEKNVESNRTNI